MSTRATYGIQGKTFYIHHDGYPAGAASYFYNMINASHKIDSESPIGRELYSGGYAEQFLRANPGAEFTPSHDHHGDTEYQYEVFFKNYIAYVIVNELGWERTEAGNKVVKNSYEETLEEFINKNIDTDWYTTDEKQIRVYRYQASKYSKSYDLYTLDNLLALLAEKEKLKKIWDENGNGRSANYISLEEEICNLYDAINVANDLGENTIVLTD